MYTAFVTAINMRSDMKRAERKQLAFDALCGLLLYASHPSEFAPGIVHPAAPLEERAAHVSNEVLEMLFPDEKRGGTSCSWMSRRGGGTWRTSRSMLA